MGLTALDVTILTSQVLWLKTSIYDFFNKQSNQYITKTQNTIGMFRSSNCHVEACLEPVRHRR